MRISAILLGAGVISSVGAIAAPIEIKTVFVGDVGNAADTDADANRNGYGSVNYDYYIGTYEVTNAEYAAFLNAVGVKGNDLANTNTYGLYNANMTSNANGGIEWNGTDERFQPKTDFAKKPVNYVSFWDAARFCNWLTTGNTETGVYDFASLAATSGLNTNGTPQNNGDISRNATVWKAGGVAIASENEWYKAAYYDPNKNGQGVGGYWTYPTQSDTVPTTDDANYNNTPGGLTNVGNYSTKPSAYGTYDQGGNVFEWNEAIINTDRRGVRGGAFVANDVSLAASARNFLGPSNEGLNLGFRVASRAPIVVPEPQTYALFGGIFLSGVIFLRRRKR